MKLVIWIIASILSAVLYRMGGAKGYNTKFRDLGCPIILIALVLLTFKIQLTIVNLSLLLLTFGLNFAALTTYFDWLFGYDNFYAHGLGCGLATIPLIWCGVPLVIILSRIVIATVGMGLWSALIGNDVWEEFGRGSLFIL